MGCNSSRISPSPSALNYKVSTARPHQLSLEEDSSCALYKPPSPDLFPDKKDYSEVLEVIVDNDPVVSKSVRKEVISHLRRRSSVFDPPTPSSQKTGISATRYDVQSCAPTSTSNALSTLGFLTTSTASEQPGRRKAPQNITLTFRVKRSALQCGVHDSLGRRTCWSQDWALPLAPETYSFPPVDQDDMPLEERGPPRSLDPASPSGLRVMMPEGAIPEDLQLRVEAWLAAVTPEGPPSDADA